MPTMTSFQAVANMPSMMLRFNSNELRPPLRMLQTSAGPIFGSTVLASQRVRAVFSIAFKKKMLKYPTAANRHERT